MSKKIFGGLLIAGILLTGCTLKNTTDVSILATSDLHGVLHSELNDYVKNEKNKDKNTTLVDAGDFYDREFGVSQDMLKFMEQTYEDYENNVKTYRECPLPKEMKDIGYDAVVLGNHEFVSNDKDSLDDLISDFKKQNIDVLSANTYKNNGQSYTKPYVVKELDTKNGKIKLGILGLTIKEVGEKKSWDGEKLVDNKSLELKDQSGYKDKLYMNDLVEDAKKWVKVMKEKEKTDVIIAVAHSGEKPKKPKNPGNRIQDLATQVSGIDAIVAGHNHVQIKQHDYKNKDGEKVIVTEPGKHGECISKINLKLKKEKDKWKVVDKSSDIVQFEKSKKYLEKLSNNIIEFDMSVYENKNKIGKEIKLKSIIPFKYDKIYVFKPNTPREKIYKTIGYKFLNISESDKHQLIFMNGDEAILYLGGVDPCFPISFEFNKSYFKDDVLIIKPNENDLFKMQKDKPNPYTNSETFKFVYKSK